MERSWRQDSFVGDWRTNLREVLLSAQQASVARIDRVGLSLSEEFGANQISRDLVALNERHDEMVRDAAFVDDDQEAYKEAVLVEVENEKRVADVDFAILSNKCSRIEKKSENAIKLIRDWEVVKEVWDAKCQKSKLKTDNCKRIQKILGVHLYFDDDELLVGIKLSNIDPCNPDAECAIRLSKLSVSSWSFDGVIEFIPTFPEAESFLQECNQRKEKDLQHLLIISRKYWINFVQSRSPVSPPNNTSAEMFSDVSPTSPNVVNHNHNVSSDLLFDDEDYT